MRSRGLTRRNFLRGGAGAAIAMPAFESLRHRLGHGQARAAGEGTQRFIVYATPLGSFAEMFFPTPPGGTPYQYPTADNFVPRERVYWTGDTPMVNPEFEVSHILEPLAAHRDELIVLEGLENSGGNHRGYCCMLTGTETVEIAGTKLGGGISIDQEIANHIGDQTRFSSLQLGVRTPSKIGAKETVSWYGEAQGAAPETDPRVAWDYLFSDLETDPEAAEQLRARQKSVLDAALGQAQDLRGDLGSLDRAKLDDYLEAFREVERKLELAPATCDRPETPEEQDWKDDESAPLCTELQLDMLAMAMACDLTRVATFQMASEATNMKHPFLGVNGRWHDLSHIKGDVPGFELEMQDYVAIQRWNAGHIASLIDRLQAFGVFDQTGILWITPMHNAQIHNRYNLPIMLAGSMGGALATGRHVRLDRDAERVVNDLHVTLLQAMGIEAETFGESHKVQGPIPELLA